MNHASLVSAGALAAAGALAFAAAVLLPPATAYTPEPAHYTLEKSDAGVWRLNTRTGAISHCTFELDPEDRLVITCLPWTD